MKKNLNHLSCVILLHGLGRTHLSMHTLQTSLQKKGYTVANVKYPSRHLAIAELTSIAIEEGLHISRQHNCQTIHFVTHSLGGILVRQYMQLNTLPGLGRVVMLGPPNQGSEVVDILKNVPGYRLYNGPAGQELGTKENDIPKKLGPVNFELGVIAGSKSINPILSILLPGQDDGKVTVENTQIDGMQDFITLPVTHTFMMQNPESIRQTIFFLENGCFDHPE